MYSKQDFIQSVKKDFAIIRHLAEKIPADKYDFKPTDVQRSMGELLHYMSYVFLLMIEVIDKNNTDLYREKMPGYPLVTKENVIEFFKQEEEAIEKYVEKFTDEELQEKISMFNGPLLPKGVLLVEDVLQSIASYKMQLFLYMKMSGMYELKTSNLWRGFDMPPTE